MAGKQLLSTPKIVRDHQHKATIWGLFTRGVPDWQFTLGLTFGFSTSSLTKGSTALGTH